eukprot:364726-Chlamydomonas_euryale.AAC.10
MAASWQVLLKSPVSEPWQSSWTTLHFKPGHRSDLQAQLQTSEGCEQPTRTEVWQHNFKSPAAPAYLHHASVPHATLHRDR